MDKLLIKLLTLSNKTAKIEKYISLLNTSKTDLSLTLATLKNNPQAYSYYKNNLPEKDILLAEFCIKLSLISKPVTKYLTHLALYPNLVYENKKIFFDGKTVILNLEDEEINLVLEILKYKEWYLCLKKSTKEIAQKLCTKYEENVLTCNTLIQLYVELQWFCFLISNLGINNELGLEIQFENIRQCYLSNKFEEINKFIELNDLINEKECEKALLTVKGSFICSEENLNDSFEIKKILLPEQNFNKILSDFDKNLPNTPSKHLIRNSLLMDDSLIHAFQCKIQENEKETKAKFVNLADIQFQRIKDTILFGRSDFMQTLFVLLRESAYKSKRSFFYILESAYNNTFKKFKQTFPTANSKSKKINSKSKKINFENEKINFENEMNLDIQIEEKDNQWNYLTLIPIIKYPLNMFINEEETNKLVYLFKILYRIKKTENHLLTLRLKQKNVYKILSVRFTDFILRLNSYILYELIEYNYRRCQFSFIGKIKLFFNEKRLAKLLVSIEEFCLCVCKNKRVENVDYVKEFLSDIVWEEGMFFKYCRWYLDN